MREPESAAAIGQLRTRFGEDRPPLIEATEHRQRVSPVSTDAGVERGSLP